ncbi:MAG: hypothetical protein LBE51_08705 [Acidovorax sp.]|jgi:hypothetical protein|nr:hypothetical protein [Acidovorax sp.]
MKHLAWAFASLASGALNLVMVIAITWARLLLDHTVFDVPTLLQLMVGLFALCTGALGIDRHASKSIRSLK